MKLRHAHDAGVIFQAGLLRLPFKTEKQILEVGAAALATELGHQVLSPELFFFPLLF